MINVLYCTYICSAVGTKSIFKNFLNVVQNFLLCSSDCNGYSSFRLQARHRWLIGTIVCKFPDKCNWAKLDYLAGPSVVPYLQIHEFRKFHAKEKRRCIWCQEELCPAEKQQNLGIVEPLTTFSVPKLKVIDCYDCSIIDEISTYHTTGT